MANGDPKTVRELWFKIQGEFDSMRVEISNIKKITFWFGGLAGAIISGVIIGTVKFLGGFK